MPATRETSPGRLTRRQTPGPRAQNETSASWEREAVGHQSPPPQPRPPRPARSPPGAPVLLTLNSRRAQFSVTSMNSALSASLIFRINRHFANPRLRLGRAGYHELLEQSRFPTSAQRAGRCRLVFRAEPPISNLGRIRWSVKSGQSTPPGPGPGPRRRTARGHEEQRKPVEPPLAAPSRPVNFG